MSAPDMFPTEGYVHFAEREADRINADKRSRQTSRLCRCPRHGTKECGNLAEQLPDKPMCFACFIADREGRPCLGVQVYEATHCKCGGTLVLSEERIICAACGLVSA